MVGSGEAIRTPGPCPRVFNRPLTPSEFRFAPEIAQHELRKANDDLLAAFDGLVPIVEFERAWSKRAERRLQAIASGDPDAARSSVLREVRRPTGYPFCSPALVRVRVDPTTLDVAAVRLLPNSGPGG